MISPIYCVSSNMNDKCVCVFQPFNQREMIHIKEKHINQQTYNSLRWIYICISDKYKVCIIYINSQETW